MNDRERGGSHCGAVTPRVPLVRGENGGELRTAAGGAGWGAEVVEKVGSSERVLRLPPCPSPTWELESVSYWAVMQKKGEGKGKGVLLWR